MKTLISLIVLMATSQAYANFKYSCFQKNGDFPLQLQMNEKQMTVLNVIEGNGSSRVGNLGFANKGLKGGTGKMSHALVFAWSKALSTVYNWNYPQEYYVQPELLKGGIRLRNGKMGGFISYVGGGYSYESYVCVLQQ